MLRSSKIIHLRAVLLLLLLLSTTKKTTSGFSCNFRTRQIPLRLIAPHAGITKNSSGISFVSSKLNNSIVNHHEEITISVSTMEQGYNKQDNQVVVAIPPLLLSCVAHTVALVGGASSIMAVMPLPAYAAATSATTVMPISSALWAYGHYVSIIAIFGCLSVEKTLVKADMTVEDENTVVKLDVIYGVMAALLIISGLFRATDYGKGGDFYIHEPLFWAKMTFAGIWGGLSIFPSITFYKRNFARKDGQQVSPLSEKLAARLQQVINAEISAVLTLPLLAALMARGVWYQPDFPWPVGLVVSLAAMGGSFYLYGKQALTWTEEKEETD